MRKRETGTGCKNRHQINDLQINDITGLIDFGIHKIYYTRFQSVS